MKISSQNPFWFPVHKELIVLYPERIFSLAWENQYNGQKTYEEAHVQCSMLAGPREIKYKIWEEKLISFNIDFRKPYNVSSKKMA